MTSGGILYPYGWTSPEVRDACGGLSDVYKLGNSSFIAIFRCDLILIPILQNSVKIIDYYDCGHR